MDVLSLNKELKLAVLNQNLERVASLLENGADATIRVNTDAGCLLHHTNDVRVASLLIDKGANMNARNRFRKTPLHLAVENNNQELVHLLLKRGCTMYDVEILSKRIPLCIAIKNNNFSIIKLLVEFGCDVNEPINNNMCIDTSLHLALKNKKIDLQVIQYLLKKGVDVNEANFAADYPIHVALRNSSCSSNLLSILIKYGADINSKDALGNTPLHCAVSTDNVELVQAVLMHSPQIISFNQAGYNPLHVALQHCVQLDIIKLLLDNNSTVILSNADQINANSNPLKLVEFVNICDKFKHSPLQLALRNIKYTDISVIKELLLRGAKTENILTFSTKVKRRFYTHNINYLYPSETNIIKQVNSHHIMNLVFKLLIEYAVINHNFNDVSDIDDSDFDMKGYMNECVKELSLVEKKLKLQLAALLNYNRPGYLAPNSLHKMIKIAIGHKYPIYKDFISCKLQRADLINVLCNEKIVLYCKNDTKYVCLDWASVSHLAKYLSKLDILNLIAVFYKSS